MAQIDKSKITKSLLSKGFRISENDHHNFRFYYRGKITSIRTKLSHGSNYKTYGDILIGQIKKQLKFRNTKEKMDFLRCSLSEEEYIAILIELKAIVIG